MQTWTIGKKLLIGVGAMFALALLMGGAGLLAARSLNNQLAQVGRHDAAASSEAAHIQYLVANLSVLTRQTVIAAARNQGAEVAAKITETNAQLAELRAARQRLDQLAGDSDVTRLSRSIDQSMVQWERKAEEAQKFAQAFSTVEAIEAIDASKSFSDSADKAAGEIVDVLRRRMDANIQSASTSYGVTFAVLVVMAIAVIAVGALVIYSVRSTVSNLVALAARLRRAGAAGMGFAVVAEEVRNLAQRSGAAARDTAAMIEESLVKARDGSAKAEVVASAIGAITDSVAQAAGLVAEVSEASRQQADGIRQVSQAVTAMEQNTQSTAATAEESAATSEELKTEANKMMEIVGQLESMVGVASDSEASPPAPAVATPRAGASKGSPDRRAARPKLVRATVRPQPEAVADGTFGSF